MSGLMWTPDAALFMQSAEALIGMDVLHEVVEI